MEGRIKLHRQIIEWEWYSDINVRLVFFHFLMLANHKDNKWKWQIIKEWQFISWINSLSSQIWLSVQQIRTAINKLKATNELTIKSTNKNSLITIVWRSKYQPKENKKTSTSTNNSTNKQQTNNKQITTNKNENNKENEKKSSKEEEQVPTHWKEYINNFIAKVESIYDKHWLAYNFSNRQYASHWINKNWITQTKMKAIEKLWYDDIFVFIEDVIVKANSIKFWNYVNKITNLYWLRNEYPWIINLTKKESNIIDKKPVSYTERELDIKWYQNKSDVMDEKVKYEKVLQAVIFIRWMDKDKKDERVALAKLTSSVFWRDIYLKARDQTKKQIILVNKN